jgi:hypothetical protein
MELPFSKKNTDTLPDIYVVSDESTRKELSSILETVRRLGSIFFSEVGHSQTGDLVEPQGAALDTIFGSFSASVLISEAKFDLFVDALHNDFRSLNKIYEERLDQQLTRYTSAYVKISKKYEIYPNKIERMILEKKLSILRHKVIILINKKSSPNFNSSDSWNALEKSILEYNKVFYVEMTDIWKNIQEIEKYHNDHSRNLLAKAALSVSVAWILLGQSTSAIQNIKNIIVFLGFDS